MLGQLSPFYVIHIMNPILIPEILDNVVGQMEHDTSSLLASSLTCKEMLPRTRFYLFNRLGTTQIDDPLDAGRQASDRN